VRGIRESKLLSSNKIGCSALRRLANLPKRFTSTGGHDADKAENSGAKLPSHAQNNLKLSFADRMLNCLRRELGQ
jgi:hypothetical protein